MAIIDAAPPVEIEAQFKDGQSPLSNSSETNTPMRQSGRRAPSRDKLIACADAAELWHDANRVPYASYKVRGHTEHWPLGSRHFRMWLASEYYRATAQGVGGTALDDVMRILEARAINDGPAFEPRVRVGGTDGKIYLDLCDDAWRAVEIGPRGWMVVEKPAIHFLRTPAMRSLPVPEPGGLVESLYGFLNTSEEDARLIIAWLIGGMRECGPYPLLVLNGEQGSGKSLASRMIRSLIDPNAAPIRSAPNDERDIVISATNSHVLCFDNLSGMSGTLSDALCRLSTGAGFATRALHTNADEMIFEAARPVLLNGIPHLADRADLSSRAITVHLRTIGDRERRPEDEFLRDFAAARPAILGALLDAVSAALRNLDLIKLDRLPRMADFAKWVTAAEPGLGWAKDSFLHIYERNMRQVEEGAFEADMIAVAIRDYITPTKYPGGFRGSPTELLNVLSAAVPDVIRRARGWPVKAQQMGNAFERAKPLLRHRGFHVERHRGGQREIVIVPPQPASDDEIPV
ncbi:hypothetical protein [Rhodoplanes sp. Z2-YC6860]|uniref:hypothetical protein n=1 Tax=Rhodoplanes sp. Z2-YC6860 TaxID=674703 RepID=UPI0018DC3AE9|nr:hypothetical protein [Rhodoplanes sp. Z2-YC6860]